MRVDQARQYNVAFEIKNLISGGWKIAGQPDLFNDPVSNKKTTLGNFPLMVIHGDDVCVFYEEGCHVSYETRIWDLYSCLTTSSLAKKAGDVKCVLAFESYFKISSSGIFSASLPRSSKQAQLLSPESSKGIPLAEYP